MNIDLTNLIINKVDKILLDIDVNFPSDYFNESDIRKLTNCKFQGNISKNYSGDYTIDGILSGVMVLADSVTLEDVNYQFKSEINEKFSEYDENFDNNLKIIKNRLDISLFLWQNILVEVPLKFSDKKNNNLTLKGDGWRLITEDELNIGNNSPFSELADKFNSRKE